MALISSEELNIIKSIVANMKRNSQAYASASEERRKELAEENEALADRLISEFKIKVKKNESGSWVLPDGQRLYDVYGQNTEIADNGRIVAKVNQMMIYTKQQIQTENAEAAAAYEEKINAIASELSSSYGVNATKNESGVWKLSDGRNLFDVYGTSSLNPAYTAPPAPTMSDAPEITAIGGGYWGGTLTSQIRPAGRWGNLAGYSWDVAGSPDHTPGQWDATWRAKSEWARTMMNDGILSSDLTTRKLTYWQKFDRFYTVDLEHENPSGRHYIFILRPDLYLVKEGTASDNVIQLSDESRVAEDPYFLYLAKMHPEIIASLTGDFAGLNGVSLANTSASAATGSGYGNSRTTDGTTLNGVQLTIHGFIPYLTSRIESMQIPDYTIDDASIVQPYTKYSIPYTQAAIKSSTGGQFDITFREDRYFSIHKLFYGWIYYQDAVMRNIFSPKKKYLMYNSLDYATSIYDFLVDETGENVLYWSKYTGCVPVSAPMSDMSFNKGGSQENRISISFKYFYCEHMDLNIIRDFNYNSLGYIYMKQQPSQLTPCSISDTVSIYDPNTRLGTNLTGRPICLLTANGRLSNRSAERVIKLRWLP